MERVPDRIIGDKRRKLFDRAPEGQLLVIAPDSSRQEEAVQAREGTVSGCGAGIV
jgi:hypothetical protein